MEKIFFTTKDLSDYTGWSMSYIYKKTHDGTFKFSKPLGKTIFFEKKWIDSFIISRPNKLKSEIKAEADTYTTLKASNHGI